MARTEVRGPGEIRRPGLNTSVRGGTGADRRMVVAANRAYPADHPAGIRGRGANHPERSRGTGYLPSRGEVRDPAEGRPRTRDRIEAGINAADAGMNGTNPVRPRRSRRPLFPGHRRPKRESPAAARRGRIVPVESKSKTTTDAEPGPKIGPRRRPDEFPPSVHASSHIRHWPPVHNPFSLPATGAEWMR